MKTFFKFLKNPVTLKFQEVVWLFFLTSKNFLIIRILFFLHEVLKYDRKICARRVKENLKYTGRKVSALLFCLHFCFSPHIKASSLHTSCLPSNNITASQKSCPTIPAWFVPFGCPFAFTFETTYLVSNFIWHLIFFFY